MAKTPEGADPAATTGQPQTGARPSAGPQARPAAAAQAGRAQPAQALDPQKLLQLLQMAGEATPYIFTFLQRLVDILQSRQQAMQAAPACPNDHLHGCCQKALDHACATVAELICAQDCCCPDDGEPTG
jgi:hypothetical protein